MSAKKNVQPDDAFMDEPSGDQEATEAAAKEPAYVRYTGVGTKRVLTADEFEQAGITDQSTLVWDSSNGKKVYIDNNINDAALERISAEPDFEIVR